MRHWLLASLLLLGSTGSRAEGPADRRAAAQRVAEDTIRELVSGPVSFRNVAAFRQGTPRAVAVCGGVRIGAASGPLTPFIVVVTYRDEESEGATVTPILATTGEGAARVTSETASRCREGGGPPPRGAGPPAPVPGEGNLRQQETRQERPAPPPPSSADGASRGDTVTARLPGSLRSSPNGRGAFIGVLRAGTSVTIYGTAPGGWYQVGDASGPSGWVHGSRLFGRP
ncbi:SH3 domain-containing protein [Muricoccus aerilatus]|uniref:SH3 domain-containing protein n=1 Tax=Muricoccus aerilatus TaxID=452982 RepID=UPI0005C1CE24|nr:SH3 domain-containing protein [Roseomonas aerilata]